MYQVLGLDPELSVFYSPQLTDILSAYIFLLIHLFISAFTSPPKRPCSKGLHVCNFYPISLLPQQNPLFPPLGSHTFLFMTLLQRALITGQWSDGVNCLYGCLPHEYVRSWKTELSAFSSNSSCYILILRKGSRDGSQIGAQGLE